MMGNKQGLLTATAVLGVAVGIFGAPPAFTNLKKVLILDKSQGGANGHLESRRDLNKALAELATDKGFQVTTIGQNDGASKISTEFSAANLATYQVVLFSNNDGVDAQLDGASKTNFENYVKNGGGFIPVHAASAFIQNWPWMTSVLVQSFYGPHGNNQPKANLAHDAEATKDGTETKGIFKGLTAPLAFLDEYYSFQSSPRNKPNVTILVTVDEKSYSAPVNGPMGNDHPVIWAKAEGKGRVVHQSMGHSWSTNNVYTSANSYLKNLLYGELRYAAGDFIGCTDATDKNYNPDATKNDATQCQGPAVNIRQGNSVVMGNWASFKQGAIHVNIVHPGSYHIQVLDVAGRVAYQTATRQVGDLAIPSLKPGIYQVRVASEKESVSRTVFTY
jgi:type 1 glutamine amidotransferase